MSLSSLSSKFQSSYKKMLLKQSSNLNKSNNSNSQSSEYIKESSFRSFTSNKIKNQRNNLILPKLTKSHSIIASIQKRPKLNLSSSNVLVVKLNLSNLNLIKSNNSFNSNVNIKKNICYPVRLNKNLALKIWDISKVVKCVKNNYIRDSLIINSNLTNYLYH